MRRIGAVPPENVQLGIVSCTGRAIFYSNEWVRSLRRRASTAFRAGLCRQRRLNRCVDPRPFAKKQAARNLAYLHLPL